MELILNGQPISTDAGTLKELLVDRGIDITQSGIAVALNDAVVPAVRWEEQLLNGGDRVEVITAMQGG